MKDLVVSAKDPKSGKSAAITVSSPETAKEGIEMFGDAPVNSNSLAHWVVTLQAGIRRELKAGKSEKEIQAKFAGAKMGVAAARTTGVTIAAIKAAWPTMSAEDKKALLADLQKSK